MYTKRAIVVNVVMTSGKRCKVVFDRYGLNSGLFARAYENEWDAERVVAQAVSEALSAALSTYYPDDTTADYSVFEID